MYDRKITPADPAAPQAELPTSEPGAPPRLRRRALKLLAIALLLGTGAYAVVSDQGYVASGTAVVTAYVVSVRAPVDGVISGMGGGVGGAVAHGAILARLENPYLSDQHLVDLREQLVRLRADLTGAQRERAALAALEVDLDRRVAAHRHATVLRLRAQLARMEATTAAKLAQRAHDARTLARKQVLGTAGFVARADLDQADAAATVSASQAEALAADVAATQDELDAARQGVLSDPAGQDVTYSAQRADEVTIRIAELDRTITALADQARETEGRMQAETTRFDRFRRADITAPLTGTIWRLASSDGERVAAGDLIAELVDCRAAFLLIAVPQDRLPDIVPDGVVRFRLLGETAQRYGMVRAITGALRQDGERHLAAIPAGRQAGEAMVLVRMKETGGSCLVGRAARVLLPSSGGAFGRLVRWFF